ncbi:hypothetical protein F4678DRAFT_480138 [Xylaria arbuscula]|nr:hypothetical protein F4678DRAFT_480138 [Xylaria arbuscula]
MAHSNDPLPPCLSPSLSSPTLQDGMLSLDKQQQTTATRPGAWSCILGSGLDSKSSAQLLFSAVRLLPVPLLLLDSSETVILANNAMGRLLGLVPESSDHGESSRPIPDILEGRTLSQIGINILEDNKPTGLSLGAFLGNLKAKMESSHATEYFASSINSSQTSAVPTPSTSSPSGISGKTCAEQTVNIVFDLKEYELEAITDPQWSRNRPTVNMIITTLDLGIHQTYYMLTRDRNLDLCTKSGFPVTKKPALEVANQHATSQCDRTSRRPPCHQANSFSMHSNPISPPSASPAISSSPPITLSSTQKMTVIKDALLDNTETPILAMWKDGSAPVFNKAAIELFEPDGCANCHYGYDSISHTELWNEDFTRKLGSDEFPTTVLLQEQKPFSGWKFGAYDKTTGKKVVYDVLGEILKDSQSGQIIGGVTTCRDITYMAQEITSIKEADEERSKVICETIPQLVWTATSDGMRDFFNKRWYEFTCCTPKDSLGEGWLGRLHPDDVTGAEAKWKHSLQTGETYTAEYRCRSKDGEWKWMLERALPLKNKKTGKIQRWFGTCTDVHETMRAKLDAKQSRKQLLSVLTHAQTTIFSVDRDQKVTMLEGALIRNDVNNVTSDDKSNHNSNPDSNHYIGRDANEVFYELVSLRKEETPQFLRPVEDIVAGRERSDTVQEHKIGQRFYKTRFMPIVETDPKFSDSNHTIIEGAIGVIMNVTELKERERDVQKHIKERNEYKTKEEEAKGASKLKSQFLANMSHEIRTPITGVIGMVEFLLDSELKPEQREYAENISDAANSLLIVINDILDFSKIESGRLDIEIVQFSLPLIIQDVIKVLKYNAMSKNLDFTSQLPSDMGDDLKLLGDPGRLRQVITNLLTNSIKFTDKGYVKLYISKEEETNETVKVKFIVKDSGIGISPQVQRRLFEPFSQGDPSTVRKYGGSGLGLTISKNLVQLMKGNIELESNMGHGTVVTFWIPFAKPQNANESPLVKIDTLPLRAKPEMSIRHNSPDRKQYSTFKSSTDELSSKNLSVTFNMSQTSDNEEILPKSERAKIHILVVEDNSINQDIALRNIAKLGFKASAVWNGQEVLDYIKDSSNGKCRKPDIILMDVQMPILDGYQATENLRHNAMYKDLARKIPIIAMTASAIQGDEEKCTKAGMDDYLSKPVKIKTLEEMLVKWSTNDRKPTPIPSMCSFSDGSESAYCGSDSERNTRSQRSSPHRPSIHRPGQESFSPDNQEIAKDITDYLLMPKTVGKKVPDDESTSSFGSSLGEHS